ncbi:MAG TPA: zf-HC2 domain-containing protein [Thermoanaerobaculia bacterium]|nr:zf-HC2 domain-containing protein [Thermoanaerobaculia bacterium]
MLDRPYITCQELIDFLHLYLDGELAAERAEEFDRHLSVCDSCVAYIDTYKTTVLLGRAAFRDPAAPVGPEVPEELVAAILAAQRRGE